MSTEMMTPDRQPHAQGHLGGSRSLVIYVCLRQTLSLVRTQRTGHPTGGPDWTPRSTGRIALEASLDCATAQAAGSLKYQTHPDSPINQRRCGVPTGDETRPNDRQRQDCAERN